MNYIKNKKIIKEKPFQFGLKDDIVLMLGYFDGLHKGHEELLNEAIRIKVEKGYKIAIFTFKNGKFNLFDTKSSSLFSYEDRIRIYNSFNIDYCIYAKITKKLKNLTKDGFIKILKNKFNIKRLVCGFDYTFGYNKGGNVEDLKNAFGSSNVSVIDCVKIGEDKISSHSISKLVLNGEIEKANQILSFPYFVSGKVKKGRRVGRKLNFPTLNFSLENNKVYPSQGVYLTCTVINGNIYRCITSIGNCPTFGVNKTTMETHVIGFDGDLYNKNIDVYFVGFYRNNIKFDNIDDLKKQLEIDKERAINDKIWS